MKENFKESQNPKVDCAAFLIFISVLYIVVQILDLRFSFDLLNSLRYPNMVAHDLSLDP